MAKKNECPNCQTPHEEDANHCGNCGANLKAKKYSKAEDPAALSKRLDDIEKTQKELKEDNEKVKKHLQEQEDEHATEAKRTKRTLFGN